MTDELSRSELDTHANLPVVGRHAYIISNTRRLANMSPFTPDYSLMQIQVVDTAVHYDTTNETGTPRACEVCEEFTHFGPKVGH
jgi:hypothetical protein